MSFNNNTLFIELNNSSADYLSTTNLPVNVSNSAPPIAGNILTATGPTSAVWQNPPLSDNGLLVGIDSGLTANYTAGRVNINGIITNIPSGTILLTANVVNGTIFIDTTGIISQSSSTTFINNCVPLAIFTTNFVQILSITDKRVSLLENIIFGLSADITNINATSATSAGTTNKYAMADHIHEAITGIPSAQTPDQVNATGISSNLARADHIHNITTSAPTTNLSATTTNTQGIATTFARSDHIHAITTGIVSTQNADQANAIGTSANLARADHIHNIPTATPSSVGSTNSLGAATTFVKSDHVHQGVHSVSVNAGAQRFGDQTLQQGTGILITDSGLGTFTFSTSGSGSSELLLTADIGLNANYTAGRVIINGTITDIIAGTILLTASTTNGTIFVNTSGVVSQSISTIFPANSIPLATYITGVATITSITDVRTSLNENIIFAAPISQTPDQVNTTGTSNNYAMSDHIHNIATAAPTTNLSATTTNSQGASSTFARSDHSHAITTGTPSAQTPDQVNADGISSNLTRADHVHNIATAAPTTNLSSASLNSVGVATTFARSDHGHAIDITGFGLNSLTGPLNVNKGGTGVATLALGNFLQGNNTGAVTAVKVVPTGVVVGDTDTQTLTNKTLTSPTITTCNATFTTTGGTPATLNFYEGPYTHTTNWSGPFASPAAGNVILYRLGNIVIAQFPAIQVAVTVSTVLTMATVLPSRFRPSVTSFYIGFIGYDNSTNVVGRIQLDSSGTFVISIGANGNNFTAAGNGGIGGSFVCSWFV